MKHKHKNTKRSKLLILLIIVLLLGISILNSIFLHPHITRSGILMYHSHYYPINGKNDSENRGPYPNHTHKDFEFFFYYLLTIVNYLPIIYILFYSNSLKILIRLNLNFNILIKQNNFYSNPLLRAPPALYFSF